MKLTKTEVDRLTCPPGRRDQLVFDDELPGFAVRVTANGAKLFLLQYRRGARVLRLPLGAFGEVTVAQARKLAEAARGRVAAGEDPAGARKAALAEEARQAQEKRAQRKAEQLTLDKLIDEWADKHLSQRSPQYSYDAQRSLRYALHALLARPAASITAAELRKVIEAIPKPIKAKLPEVPAPVGVAGAEKRGKNAPPPPALRGEAQARRVRAHGSALFNWAMQRELVPANPFQMLKPIGREVARERVLTDAELGEIWRGCDALGHPWGPYFKLLLLTLQRENEVVRMEWAELSPDRRVWELPGKKTKNRKPHVVHLSPQARDVLASVPVFVGSPLVFTTTGRTPLRGFSHAKLRLDAKIAEARRKAAEAAGKEPEPAASWRLHDFRRTGVTVMARLGVSVEVADKVLNHIQGAIRGVMAVYQRHDFYEERRAAMELWAAHLLAASGETDAAGAEPAATA